MTLPWYVQDELDKREEESKPPQPPTVPFSQASNQETTVPFTQASNQEAAPPQTGPPTFSIGFGAQQQPQEQSGFGFSLAPDIPSQFGGDYFSQGTTYQPASQNYGLPPGVPSPWQSDDYGWQNAAVLGIQTLTGGLATPTEHMAGLGGGAWTGLPYYQGPEYPDLPEGFEHLQGWMNSGSPTLQSAAWAAVDATTMRDTLGIMPAFMTQANRVAMGYSKQDMADMGYVEDPLGFFVRQADASPTMTSGGTGQGGGQNYYPQYGGYGGVGNYPSLYGGGGNNLINWRIG